MFSLVLLSALNWLSIPSVVRCVSGDAIKARIPQSNRQIRARQVRLIGSDGKQIGVMSLDQAIRMAAEQNLDVVLTRPGDVPICKLQSLNELRTQLRATLKREEATAVPDTKEIQLRIGIEENDLATKLSKANEILSKGGPVRVVVRRADKDPKASQELLDKCKERLASNGNCKTNQDGSMMCQPVVSRAVLYKKRLEAEKSKNEPGSTAAAPASPESPAQPPKQPLTAPATPAAPIQA